MPVFWEIFGYIGTALVIISMMMTSVTKLRIFNIAGSVISATYSAVSHAGPIVVMNVCLIGINAFHLAREARHQHTFGHIVTTADDQSVRYFVNLYAEDIEKFFPGYRPDEWMYAEIHMVYIGSEAVGLLVGARTDDVFSVDIDYAIPKYRDLSVAGYLFPLLKKEGITTLTARALSDAHRTYLEKVGFEDDGGIMIKHL